MSTGITRSDPWLESFAFHDESGTYRASFDPETTSASIAVIGALSEVLGTGPTDIEPLYETIDTDALDEIVHPRAAIADVEVSFILEGHNVTVTIDGTIEIEAQAVDVRAHSTGRERAE